MSDKKTEGRTKSTVKGTARGTAKGAAKGARSRTATATATAGVAKKKPAGTKRVAPEAQAAPAKPDGSSLRREAAKKTAVAIALAALDKKAERVEIVDISSKVDYADYLVVMTGRSDRQVVAIAQGIEESLQRKEGVRTVGMEGLPQGHWVLIDYSDVIVHVFLDEARKYYDLEGLWLDAPRVPTPSFVPPAPAHP